MEARPTLSSVAARAGVSRQTVSNVLNSPEIVLPETRARVLAAITETGYRRNRAARQLRTRHSREIGLGIRSAPAGASRQVLDLFLHEMVEQAQREDYRVVLFSVGDDVSELSAIQHLVATSDLEGFVLTDTNAADVRIDWLQDHAVPFVAFGRPWRERSTHSWIDVDGAAGLREATDHLVELGYRRIAFLGWRASESGDDRRAGWLTSLRAHGLAGPDAAGMASPDTLGSALVREVEGDSTPRAAIAARDLYAAGADAIVCASDALALGALSVARELVARGDLTDPVGIVGFDDSAVAHELGLSSVAQPIAQVVKLVLGALLPRLRGEPDVPPTQALVAPTLQARASSRFHLFTP